MYRRGTGFAPALCACISSCRSAYVLMPVRSIVGRASLFGWTLAVTGRVPFPNLTCRARVAHVRPAPPHAQRKGVSPVKINGTVKFFNAAKGFGFIAPEDGSKDVFVHVTALEAAGIKHLNE